MNWYGLIPLNRYAYSGFIIMILGFLSLPVLIGFFIMPVGILIFVFGVHKGFYDAGKKIYQGGKTIKNIFDNFNNKK